MLRAPAYWMLCSGEQRTNCPRLFGAAVGLVETTVVEEKCIAQLYVFVLVVEIKTLVTHTGVNA